VPVFFLIVLAVLLAGCRSEGPAQRTTTPAPTVTTPRAVAQVRAQQVSESWSLTAKQTFWMDEQMREVDAGGLTLRQQTGTEPALAVDPKNPQVLMAAWHGAQLHRKAGRAVPAAQGAISTDGGKTWQATRGSQQVTQFWSGEVAWDNVLAGRPQGGFVWAINGGSPDALYSDVSVAVSESGPAGFQTRSIVFHQPLDKPWVTTDKWSQSPHYGALYVCSGPSTDGDLDGVAFARSTNGGVNWIQEKSLFGLSACYLTVTPDGVIHLIANTLDTAPEKAQAPVDSSTGLAVGNQLIHTASRDGGKTWSARHPVMRNVTPLWNLYIGEAPRVKFFVPAIHAAAATANGALWVITALGNEGCVGGECTQSMLQLAVSRDGGVQWSAPVKIGAGDSDQFLPALTAHADSTVSIFWLNRARTGTDPYRYEPYYSNTRDGQQFLTPQAVGAGTHGSILTANVSAYYAWLGDYTMAATTGDGVAHYIWPQTVADKPANVYVSSVTLQN
jgi:hypothetical protein